MPFPGPGGQVKLGHAELEIGDSRLFLSDEFPEQGNVGPAQLAGESRPPPTPTDSPTLRNPDPHRLPPTHRRTGRSNLPGHPRSRT